VTIALEPGEASKTLGYDAVYYETLKGQKGYLRSHVFQLVGSQAANAAVSEERTLPKFLAVHEFEDRDIPSMILSSMGQMSRDRSLRIARRWLGISGN
jgi:hypothetical protein